MVFGANARSCAYEIQTFVVFIVIVIIRIVVIILDRVECLDYDKSQVDLDLTSLTKTIIYA